MKIWLASLAVLIIMTGRAATDPSPAPFALVELFASEGCSSCPPADDLLRKVTADARANGKPIYTLSFEVDYWDYLGWKDPFSSPQFTQRQQQYARVLASSNVYTPQMIINGKEAFVGSDAGKARHSIEKYLNVQPENIISLSVDQSAADLKINYVCDKQVPNAVLNIALVERGVESRVTAGENVGSTLVHDNIVREFKTVDFNDVQGTVLLSKPQGNDLSRFSVIVYLQSKKNMAILIATGIDLK